LVVASNKDVWKILCTAQYFSVCSDSAMKHLLRNPSW